MSREQWIWLPREQYPDRQEMFFNEFTPKDRQYTYTVVKITRNYGFGKAIKKATVRCSADVSFVLRCNGTVIARGPACGNGDFLYYDRTQPKYYATECDLPFKVLGESLRFEVTVRAMPTRIDEYSRSQSGFFLDGQVEFEDGTVTLIGTDERWDVCLQTAYVSDSVYDGTVEKAPTVKAELVNNIWHTETAPIPPCTLELKTPATPVLTVNGGETVSITTPFDKIYAGYFYVNAVTNGRLTVTLEAVETPLNGQEVIEVPTVTLTLCEDTEYEGLTMHSIGEYRVTVANEGTGPATVSLGMIASCFPVDVKATTVTSDEDLNLVMDVCAHTLQYCRQTHHLDSPRHCEPLACPGDYYIELLATAATFGDFRLAAFDIRRIADLLLYQDGRLFHTSYSLIWVLMLYDAYMLTADKQLLADCEDALLLLLERFETYMGDNGLIETPPDYMFIDWLVPDGISTHHPPKALGQTCLCLFLFAALKKAEEIFALLGRTAMSARCREKAAALRTAIVDNLYDAERGLFFEGLNTPTPEHLIGNFMPQNVDKRYYRRHANVLAAYVGVLDRDACAALLARIAEDDSLGEVQPYFMHFWLEAVRRNGLCDTYTLSLLELWKQPIKECPKGLVEGFYRPEPNYVFDHSHAWGGTPAYSLPMALTGFEMLEAGYKKIRLSPSLLGLAHARVELPTPYGMIVVTQTDGEQPCIIVPSEITWVTD